MLPDVDKYIPDQSPVLAKDMNTLGQIVRMLNGISGPNVFVDASGIHFRPPPAPKRIWVWFTAQTKDGTNYRWEYTWVEIHKATAGFDGWEELDGGRFGGGEDDDYGYAYNTVEDINGSGLATSDPYGNGVVQDNIDDTGLEVQPVPLYVPVLADIVYPEDGDRPELSFAYENGVDGPCDP